MMAWEQGASCNYCISSKIQTSFKFELCTYLERRQRGEFFWKLPRGGFSAVQTKGLEEYEDFSNQEHFYGTYCL